MVAIIRITGLLPLPDNLPCLRTSDIIKCWNLNCERVLGSVVWNAPMNSFCRDSFLFSLLQDLTYFPFPLAPFWMPRYIAALTSALQLVLLRAPCVSKSHQVGNYFPMSLSQVMFSLLFRWPAVAYQTLLPKQRPEMNKSCLIRRALLFQGGRCF